MRNGVWTTALVALGMIGGLASHASAQTLGSNFPRPSRAGVSLDGTVSQVDADRDRVVVGGDDGRTYTVDTYRTDIRLRDTARSGQTGDLVPGMRLHITGTRLSRDLIESDHVVVLPYRSVRSTRPVVSSPAPVFAPGRSVTLRGTVESVDDRQGSFVLRINDHTRAVFVDDRTDLGDFSGGDGGGRLPFHTGDRVSVVGVSGDDGTVDASLVTPRILGSEPGGDVAPVQHGRTLLGRVSKESDFFSRDIKMRLSVDREITVLVPKDIPIRRNGHALSVHDLKDDQVIRVTGDYDGDAFQADRIEVLPDSAGDRLDF